MTSPGTRGASAVPLVVASALFMDLMDSAALATALPTLSRAFHTTPFDLKFSLTAYLLTIAVCVPASGWLSDRFGAKRLFMAAMGLFMIGSICCGLSNTVGQLVAARVLQGLGGSMMAPVGRSIVVASTPREALVKGMAMFTLPAILGPLAGPPIAGLILEHGSWRWIFLMNVPVGVLGLLAVGRYVPRMPSVAVDRFDMRGFLLFASLMLTLMTLFETASIPGLGWLRIVALLVSVVVFGCYRLHSRRIRPIVDLSLLRIDTLSLSLLAGWLQRMPLGALPFLLPLLLQVGMHISPLGASKVMVAAVCGSLLSRFLMPPVVRRWGFRRSLMIFGLATAVLSAAPAWFQPSTPMLAMMGIMALCGLARSGFFIPMQTLAYANVEPRDVAQASILFTVAQQLSFSLGVSMAAWLLKLSAGGGKLSPETFRLPFIVMAGIAGLSVIAIWRLRRDAGEEVGGNGRSIGSSA